MKAQNTLLYRQVAAMLFRNHATRDNGRLLVKKVHELYGVHDKMELGELWAQIELGKIPKDETITRYSRNIQELNSHLRGKNWGKRQGKQITVKQHLGYNV